MFILESSRGLDWGFLWARSSLRATRWWSLLYGFSSFWAFVCGLFQRDTTWTALFCSCWFLGQESSTLLFPVHVLCIIKGLSLPCKCVAFDFSFNGFLSHVGLHFSLNVAVYEKKKKQKRKKSDFKNSVVTESFFRGKPTKCCDRVFSTNPVF